MSDTQLGAAGMGDLPTSPRSSAENGGVARRLRGHVSRLLLRKAMARLHHGSVSVTTPDGDLLVRRADLPGPDATLHMHRWRTMWRLLMSGDVGFAAAYIDGDWSSPDPSAIIELAARNDDSFGRSIDGSLPTRIVNRLRHARRDNSRRGSARNIIAHYDLGNEFFSQWLDRDMSYSSALYRDGTESLEAAQIAKQDLIIDKLGLTGGERVLEIGCGWGSLAQRMIERGCHVTGSPCRRRSATMARRASRAPVSPIAPTCGCRTIAT